MSDTKQTTQEPLWTMAELVGFLRISRRTARRWMKDRGLPYSKPGGEYRFAPSQVRAWLRYQGRP